MPLDRAKAKSLISSAQAGYTRGPHADFIAMLADQLSEALKIVDDATVNVLRAQNETQGKQRELDEVKTLLINIGEQNKSTAAMVTLLREISKSPKGAAKKAEELLKVMGSAEEVVAAPVEIE